MAIIDKIQLSGTVYTIGNETTTAVTSASTDNEIPTAKAVYDAIPQGGGGKAIVGGRGITVTSGDTADTVSFNLPISAGTGINSLVIGDYNSADHYGDNKASGRSSIAGGSNCTAATSNSFAFGYNNKAAGGGGSNANFAQGYMTTASGNRCHSEGLGTSATSDASHSEGYNTVASGNYSHSEGEEVKATNVAEHSQGRYNVSNKANTTFGNSGNTLFSVGNGTSDSTRHNAFEIRQNGDIYLTKDGQDVKLQDQLGGGSGKAVSGGTNISVTTGETADTINCTLPYYKLSGEENYSIYGQTNTSFKNQATYAYQSLFIGFSNEVKGNSSSMSYSSNYVIGTNNKINGKISYYLQGYNVVIGDHNSLSGTNLSYSYVIGKNNSGYTSNTLLTGWYNQAHNAYESSFGKYNASNTGSTDADKSLFSVGNGTSSARHNAFEIRQNGDIYCSDGTNDVKLQDTIKATAANTTALGGLSLVKLTQAQYDALATKDSNVLYVIVG